MKNFKPKDAAVTLIRDLGDIVKEKSECQPMLEATVAKIGSQLKLDRCIIMLVKDKETAAKDVALDVVAEYVSCDRQRLGPKKYRMSGDTRFFSALKAGQVVRFSALKAGQVVRHGVSMSMLEPNLENQLDRYSCAGESAFLKFVADSQSKSFILFPLTVRGQVFGCLSMHYCDEALVFADDVVELGMLSTEVIAVAADRTLCLDESRAQNSEETVNKLSKQISWERWARQIVCKLHATLDRDVLLQTAVDSFGRALGASRCLIVRDDTNAPPVVTHEYVDSNISPLGLGRTEQFPSAALSLFRQKVTAIADVTSLTGKFSAEDAEYFSEHGVRGMVGAPLLSHGNFYGVIIILECGPVREWSSHELDMLELVATQTAVALGHCHTIVQLKEQLFNMNLLGNLTQQLTSTLELAGRNLKTDGGDEKKLASTAPPLSLRELEVLKLIASGLANREIAQRLFLTESTVELHASRIRKKLKLKSRTALVKFACDNGLA